MKKNNYFLIIYIIIVFQFVSCNMNNNDNNSSNNSSDDNDSLSKVLSFSGYEWVVRSSKTKEGPGPNYFSSSAENVWIDEDGYLHLKITRKNNKWYCAEIYSKSNFGYGKYIFNFSTQIDQIDKNVVVGLFTWDDDPDYNHREIDIEFSKWGDALNENSQFVVQPWNRQGDTNIHRFNINDVSATIHSFDWENSSIEFKSIFEATEENWIYNGGDVPIPGNEKACINFWLCDESPSDDKEAEIIITKFEYIP